MRKGPFILGAVVLLLGLVVLLFQWDWLIPVVDRKASAALGRTVSIAHLHVHLGRVPRIEADEVRIANPADWPEGGDFATSDKLVLDLDALAYIRHRQVVIPAIELDHPQVDVRQLASGKNNYGFGSTETSTAAPTPPEQKTRLGTLQINDGHVHTVLAKLGADFQVQIATKNDKVEAEAHGTYANAPITASFVGGALLSLRDSGTPYPVDAKLTNGPTHLALDGTVENPLDFAGAKLKLDLAGPDMSLLLPLTGIAIPKTPAYNIAGQLDYEKGVVKFNHAQGKVGSSDLEGNLEVDTKPETRPILTADFHSNRVDLKDLAGFIGAEPGNSDKGTKKVSNNNGRVLPNEPVSLPRLNAVDVHLKYRAARIEGRAQPLDNMRADLDIVNGEVKLHPLAFGIGGGQIAATIELSEKAKALHAQATIDFQRVSVDKLLAATGAARGAGSIGGRAVIDGTGRSLAEILGHGNGELKLYMGSGGNVSALLVDLSGLQFGNALLSALGVPTREQIQCLITDFVLQQGLVTAKTVLLDTDASRVGGTGTLNLASESMNFVLRTEAKHFSLGSLPAPVDVTGTLAAPSVRPDVAVLAARAGAAVGLGILLTPLGALLPTIQLGIGEDGACAGLLQQAKTPPRVVQRRR